MDTFEYLMRVSCVLIYTFCIFGVAIPVLQKKRYNSIGEFALFVITIPYSILLIYEMICL
jgi:hypothetical protein